MPEECVGRRAQPRAKTSSTDGKILWRPQHGPKNKRLKNRCPQVFQQPCSHVSSRLHSPSQSLKLDSFNKVQAQTCFSGFMSYIFYREANGLDREGSLKPPASKLLFCELHSEATQKKGECCACSGRSWSGAVPRRRTLRVLIFLVFCSVL